mmetsp:Transcript_10236/g.18662  ORF Transcript_10236/g.18662 Transcript_10236/m.18662 type:complete len:613 (-) Transcript_10236:240-2078(-)|eukprot:CAMPEP_0197543196 /NCGR_PEP_ID=MMETSP1318-20131121/68060_1 /TAXON_ID=552666 /ORGANISM="Partenskyella glossopodia, Strain RCC365" /LENGTH=612 /DNA_ID=CAMNT_0043102515 /DNA_START=602 /DNA_END=2440 /DNA_ORIENTATION=+
MIGPYILKRVLGHGSASVVRQAEHKDTGEQVAVKIIVKDANPTKRRKSIKACREISILRAIEHSNVVKLHQTFESQTHFFLVMELVKGMELFDYLINKGKLMVNEALVIFSQVVRGLVACHERGVVHRDLKAENILLDTEGNVKIVDFELANFVRSEPLKTFCGSSYYAPPEICAGNIYDGEKADVWSIGVLLYMMVVGEYPFDDENDAALIKKIIEQPLQFPESLGPEIRDLIERLLRKDPKERIRATEIQYHKCFFEGGRNLYFDITQPPPSPSTASDRRVQVLENLVLELERQLLPEVQMSFSNLNLVSATSPSPNKQHPHSILPPHSDNVNNPASSSSHQTSSNISSNMSNPLQALAQNPDWQHVSHSVSGGSINSGGSIRSADGAHGSLSPQVRQTNAPQLSLQPMAEDVDTKSAYRKARQMQVRNEMNQLRMNSMMGTVSKARSTNSVKSSEDANYTITRMDGDDPLWWIMYRSQLEVKKSDDPIEMIKKIARDSLQKNRSLGIGGMLYCDRKTGRIIQILEGKRSVLKQLAATIMMDTRHQRFMIIKNEGVPERRFKDWGMSFANTLSSFQRSRMSQAKNPPPQVQQKEEKLDPDRSTKRPKPTV